MKSELNITLMTNLFYCLLHEVSFLSLVAFDIPTVAVVCMEMSHFGSALHFIPPTNRRVLL